MHRTYLESKNLTAPSGIRHGFFTSDKAEFVAQHFDIRPDAIRFAKQTHSANVFIIDGSAATLPEADSMVTREKEIVLAVKTADCAPILLADPRAKVIGAIHAGWRGAIGGIIENTIECMTKLGAAPAQIIGAVGPCISQANYEVGPEFITQFLQDDSANRHFFIDADKAGYAKFDLPAYVLAKMRNCGLRDVSWSGHCTFQAGDKWPSRRYYLHLNRHQGNRSHGSFISGIMLDNE